MMMMMMKKPAVLLACVLLLSTLTVIASKNPYAPEVCCFKFFEPNKPVRKENLLSFKYTDKQCAKRAVLLTMKNGKELCADPTEQWVNDLISKKLY